MPINCKHENLKFARFGCFMPELGVSRILWECVDCCTILSFNIRPALDGATSPRKKLIGHPNLYEQDGWIKPKLPRK